MAEAILGLLMQNLNTLLQAEFARLSGVQDDMQKLISTLSTIRDVVEDAELKQIADKPLSNWLQKLKNAANDADDVLDEWHTKALQSEHTEVQRASKSFKQKLCECISSSVDVKQIVFSHKMGNKIRKIISTFDEIAAEKSKFHLSPGVSQNRVEYRETSSLLVEEKVYGREGDHEKIVNVLLNNVNHEDAVSVLPIQGIGGLGKTTLAQLVYNDQRVKNHFDARGWVCVSDDFDVKRLTRMIIESYSKQCDFQDLDPMQGQLQELLRGKKFLLVLDDVWSDDRDKWDRLKHSLTSGAKGSSIIVTTRLATVASIVGTLPRHSLGILSEEDCWSLFKGRAFGVGNEETPELVEIGKQIVKKCGGVPLAAKSLGGLMGMGREVTEWLHVRDSQIWELPQDGEDGILPALRVSYNHLPSHMRQCFSFCSIFPKDYRINKEELIHLWMANGFVQPCGGLELEDFGNLVFNELLRKSFFQDSWKDVFGNVRSCKMHDLMHDLACSISGKECCFADINKATLFFHKGIRHMSISVGSRSPEASEFRTIQTLVESNPALRTLLFVDLEYKNSFDICEINFRNVNHLRALDVSETSTKMVPATIGKMKHLRYLNLSGTSIRSLPDSFSNLRNLQSLKMRGCHGLEILPNYISKLRSLRHLDVEELTEMPDGMGQLTQLQTLRKFVVGPKSGRHIKELQGLNNLRGKLEMIGLEHVRSIEDANLTSKQKLEELNLEWSMEDSEDGELQKKVIEEGLRPHPNLKVLSVTGYRGSTLPSWMPLLTNLVEISLYDCNMCKSLSALGQLPLLKELSLDGMKSVKRMGDEFYGTTTGLQHFPSLELLYISRMPNLEEWWAKEDPRQAFPCLKKLTIRSCPKVRALPDLTSLETLEIKYCESLKCLPVMGIQGLKSSLTRLEIRDCSNLTSVSKGLQHLTSLETLKIVRCPELVFSEEDFEHLLSLRTLRLGELPKLIALPEGMQHLTRLQHLQIANCHPVLHRRCEKDKGEDWHIISHIPHLVNIPPKDTTSEDTTSEEEEPAVEESRWYELVHKLRDILKINW